MRLEKMIRFSQVIAIILLLTSCSSIEKSPMGTGEPGWHGRSGADASLRIGIVYDNKTSSPRLKAANGFSCVVDFCQKTILFDTGGNGPILLENMAKMGIESEKNRPRHAFPQSSRPCGWVPRFS